MAAPKQKGPKWSSNDEGTNSVMQLNVIHSLKGLELLCTLQHRWASKMIWERKTLLTKMQLITFIYCPEQGWGCSSVVEHLTWPGSIPGTGAKKKKNLK